MLNPNWNRWIFASVSTFFKSKTGTLPFYIEGTDKAGRRKDKDYAEFRMDGPLVREISKDVWKLTFIVNVLVCSLFDETDFHRIYKDVGIVTTMFDGKIPIYKLGDNPGDAPTELLGCAVREDEGRMGGTDITHYGQYDPTLPVLQSTVEASYKLYLNL